MLIAMAGLPGTGKSAVARALRDALTSAGVDAVVLDKDKTRAALFTPETIEYSAEQDDLCVEILLQVAAFLLRREPARVVILDGRTFTHRRHVERVVEAAHEMGAEHPVFIECRCAEATALRRLEDDRAEETHPAANRGPALYLKLKAEADPLELPHLAVNTEGSLASAVRQCEHYIRSVGLP